MLDKIEKFKQKKQELDTLKEFVKNIEIIHVESRVFEKNYNKESFVSVSLRLKNEHKKSFEKINLKTIRESVKNLFANSLLIDLEAMDIELKELAKDCSQDIAEILRHA